jgi:hypothetical protein
MLRLGSHPCADRGRRLFLTKVTEPQSTMAAIRLPTHLRSFRLLGRHPETGHMTPRFSPDAYAHYIAKLNSKGHMWPGIFSRHRQTMTLEKLIKAHHRVQNLIAEVGIEQQPEARSHPSNSLSSSGSSSRASTARLQLSAPKRRRPRGVDGTRRTAGTLPRVMKTSSPVRASAIRRDRFAVA